MDITCISDMHGHYPELDGGDLLVIAGDLTAKDEHGEYFRFMQWLDSQDYTKKVFIAGNHDNNIAYVEWREEYLCDSGTEFEGLKMWGSPWTRSFEGQNPQCMAFTKATEDELAEKWALIPKDTDILITHSPCFGVFDQTIWGEHVGSKSLAGWNNGGKRLLLHVCGHIHEGYGYTRFGYPIGKAYEFDYTTYVNASHVNEDYKPVNKPIRVIL